MSKVIDNTKNISSQKKRAAVRNPRDLRLTALFVEIAKPLPGQTRTEYIDRVQPGLV